MSTVTLAPARGALSAARDNVSLLKLRIVALLDVTAVAVMLPAAHGHPRPVAVAAVLIGLTCGAGGAHAINMWFDRDIDAEMTRTRRRPLPAGRIPPWHALALGIGLNVVAFAVLWAGANLFAAALDLVGALIYVFVYTIWLKRSTPQNIVIGGAAGAVPPLVGWAAATGHLDATALAFFGVIFFWTPPHFWALAQMLKTDYARASVPMLPAVGGERSAKRQSIAYAVRPGAAESRIHGCAPPCATLSLAPPVDAANFSADLGSGTLAVAGDSQAAPGSNRGAQQHPGAWLRDQASESRRDPGRHRRRMADRAGEGMEGGQPPRGRRAGAARPEPGRRAHRHQQSPPFRPLRPERGVQTRAVLRPAHGARAGATRKEPYERVVRFRGREV